MTDVLIKWGNLDAGGLAQREGNVKTQGEGHVKVEVWSDASTSPGTLQATRCSEKGMRQFLP